VLLQSAQAAQFVDQTGVHQSSHGNRIAADNIKDFIRLFWRHVFICSFGSGLVSAVPSHQIAT
jgi:hypothetical protein